MKMKTVVAAVLSLAASASFATAFDLGPLDNSSSPFGRSFLAGAGAFWDTYSFQITNPGTIASLAIAFQGDTFFNISNFTAQLYQGATALGPIAETVTSFTNLGAGTYYVSLTGSVTGSAGGAYGGFVGAVTAPVTVTTPVPEPETYAMMLAGLAAVAFLTRRRQNG